MSNNHNYIRIVYFKIKVKELQGIVITNMIY